VKYTKQQNFVMCLTVSVAVRIRYLAAPLQQIWHKRFEFRFINIMFDVQHILPAYGGSLGAPTSDSELADESTASQGRLSPRVSLAIAGDDETVLMLPKQRKSSKLNIGQPCQSFASYSLLSPSSLYCGRSYFWLFGWFVMHH